MKRTMKILVMAGLLLAAATVFNSGCRKKEAASTDGAPDYWVTDFEKAQQLAQQQNKDILINFSGSDWCYWCQKLDKEVFSRDAFHEQADEKYVFLLIDFPQDKSGQSDAVQRQNEKLAERFGIQGFPTVLLADASGRPYARTGYMEGGARAYLEHLKELRTQKILP